MSQGALLDLVCGPTSPLPETYQRYRLVAHLGSGGQAEVYRAVRLCGGVSSAPMTVKAFRVDPARPLADELRSWDKGDAALMDLNNRGVGGICRRADGFYGPPPHQPGERPAAVGSVPYQVYDYLHGVNLREYVLQRAGLAPGGRRLNAVAALTLLAGVLRALHHPQQSGATPVLHMDVKPSNVMVLTTGEVRLIDFTGARYWREEEITQIAYTPESGGPEAFGGASQVSPAYDVHGFGAVAYFLVTGAYPRVDAGANGHGAASPPPWSVLRRLPALEQLPALRDHLHAPLADRPGDRPMTPELAGWVNRLVQLVRHADLARRSDVPDIGVDWADPPDRSVESSRVSGRAVARPPLTGTETDAFQRIERLERELVELRAAATEIGVRGMPAVARTRQAPPPQYLGGMPGVVAPHGSAGAAAMVGAVPRTAVAPAGGLPPFGAPSDHPLGLSVSAPPSGDRPTSDPPASNGRGLDAGSQGAGSQGAGSQGAGSPGTAGAGPQLPMRGRASVPPPRPVREDTSMVIDPLQLSEPQRWRPPDLDTVRTLKVGSGLTITGAIIAFLCWGIWAASVHGRLTAMLGEFGYVLVVGAGVFALARLLGWLILERRLGRVRRSARASHAITGLFLVAAGIAYLQQTGWVMSVLSWVGTKLF